VVLIAKRRCAIYSVLDGIHAVRLLENGEFHENRQNAFCLFHGATAAIVSLSAPALLGNAALAASEKKNLH
jgi:hypothetical protein